MGENAKTTVACWDSKVKHVTADSGVVCYKNTKVYSLCQSGQVLEIRDCKRIASTAVLCCVLSLILDTMLYTKEAFI